MPTISRRVAILGLGGLACFTSGKALAAAASQERSAQSVGAGQSPSAVSVALRLFPPFGYAGKTNIATQFGLGGLGVGVIARGGLWTEASVRHLQGLEGMGYDATLLVGYVASRQAPRDAWEFTVPFHVGYRYAARPNTEISDGVVIIEPLHLFVAGARAVWSRHYRVSAVELSLGALGGPVLWRVDPNHVNYSDGTTRFWLEATAAIGFVIDG